MKSTNHPRPWTKKEIKMRPVMEAIDELQGYLDRIKSNIQNQDPLAAYHDAKNRSFPKIAEEIEKKIRAQLFHVFQVGCEVSRNDPNALPKGTGTITRIEDGYVFVEWKSINQVLIYGDPTSLVKI